MLVELMIADHKLLTEVIEAAQGFGEHSPGMISSVITLAIYAFFRDGLPRLKRWKEERTGGNPGHNPGNGLLAQRLVTCETAINDIKESCTRTETLWEGQKEFNGRMEKHIGNIYEKFDKLAGG